MPLVGVGYLLPDDVRSEYGFQTALTPNPPGAGQVFSRKVPGEYFEVVSNVFCSYTTSATAVTRAVLLQAYNGDGILVDNITAFLTQGASTTFNYRWSTTVTAAYSIGGTVAVMPLFPFVMPPGWTLKFNVTNGQAGDTFQQIGVVLQQYNTGIERDVQEATVVHDLSGLGASGGSGGGSSSGTIVVAGGVVQTAPSPTGAPVTSSPAPSGPAPTPAPTPAPAPAPEPTLAPSALTGGRLQV